MERLGFELEDRLTVLEPCDELALVLPGEPPDFASLEVDITDANARTIEAVSRPTLASDAASIEGLRRDARTFVFPQVASGAYELRLSAAGFAPHTQTLELAPGERARVQVVFEVGAPVNVRVTPRPHMQLRVVAESTQHGTRGGKVEPIGLAKLGVLAPGTWTVGLVADSSTEGTPAWLSATRSFEVAAGDAPLEWTLECPELGRVRLVLPVHGPDDPPLPVAELDLAADGSLAASDQNQAWWTALNRSKRRAEQIDIELEDSTGTVVLRTTPEHVYLDTERQRVRGFITAPVGNYTLVVRRGTETLRRAPVQVLAETTVDLDP